MDLDNFIEKDIEEFLKFEMEPQKEKVMENAAAPELQSLSVEERDYEKEFNLAVEEGRTAKAREILTEVKDKLSKADPGSYQKKYFQELYDKLSPLLGEHVEAMPKKEENQEEIEHTAPTIQDKKPEPQTAEEDTGRKMLDDFEQIITEEKSKLHDSNKLSHAIQSYNRLKDILKKEKVSEDAKKKARQMLLDLFKEIKERLHSEITQKAQEVQLAEEKDRTAVANDFAILTQIKSLKKKLDSAVIEKDLMSSINIYEEMKKKAKAIQDDILNRRVKEKLETLKKLLKELENNLKDIRGSEELERREKRIRFHLP